LLFASLDRTRLFVAAAAAAAVAADQGSPRRRHGADGPPRYLTTTWATRACRWRRFCARFGGRGGRHRGQRHGSRRRIGGPPDGATERRAAHGVGAPCGRLVHVRGVVFARVFARVLGAAAAGTVAGAAAHVGGSTSSAPPLRRDSTSKVVEHCVGTACALLASFLHSFWGLRRPAAWPAPRFAAADRRPPRRRRGAEGRRRRWSTAWAPRARPCRRFCARFCARFGGRGDRHRGQRRGSRRRIGGLPIATTERWDLQGVATLRGRPVRVRGVVSARVFARVLGAASAGTAAGAASRVCGAAFAARPVAGNLDVRSDLQGGRAPSRLRF